jgi:hypothetical protein
VGNSRNYRLAEYLFKSISYIIKHGAIGFDAYEVSFAKAKLR